MRPHPLAFALAAGIVACVCMPAAQAINLNPRGTGQVLVFPYYTVNGGNQTLITVVNGTEVGKALKIRFREGRNARSVLAFNVYLGEYDIWTGAVFSLSDTGPDNPANLVSTDNSCAVPAIKGNAQLPRLSNGNRYVPFSNAAYTGTSDDAGPDTLQRTREGYFEVFELGEVVDRTHGTFSAIAPDPEGNPPNCQLVRDAWSPGSMQPYWTADPLIDTDPPGGGLYGHAAIIDALGGTMLSYRADAIEHFSDVAQHTAPNSPAPSLATPRSSADSAVAQVIVDGRVVTSSYPLAQAVDAVSAVFTQHEIFNAFTTSPAIGGASEWVVTFPTKFAYTDQAIVGSTAIAPFTEVFPTSPAAAGIAPVFFVPALFDRESGPNWQWCEGEPPLDPYCIWPNPGDPQFYWASNVLSFNQRDITQGTRILGSRNAIDYEALNLGLNDGWMHLTFHRSDRSDAPLLGQRLRPDRAGGRWDGLPVRALLVESYTNGQLTPGVLSNYAGASRHRGDNRYAPAQP